MDKMTNEQVLEAYGIAYATDNIDIIEKCRTAVLERMADRSDIVERCDALKALAAKCMKDLTGDRTSESQYDEDEKQQLSTFMGMISAAALIVSDMPLNVRAP